MPDNSIEKKLTFVEWVARETCSGDIEWAKRAIQLFLIDILKDKSHTKDCGVKNSGCELCAFEAMLLDYRKYFKKVMKEIKVKCNNCGKKIVTTKGELWEAKMYEKEFKDKCYPLICHECEERAAEYDAEHGDITWH